MGQQSQQSRVPDVPDETNAVSRGMQTTEDSAAFQTAPSVDQENEKPSTTASQRDSLDITSVEAATTPRAASAHSGDGATSDSSNGDSEVQRLNAVPEIERVVFAEQYPVTNLNFRIVGWDGQDDPCNPRNFSACRKGALLGLMGCISLVISLSSSMIAPAMSDIRAQFHQENQMLSDLAVSIILVGKGVGPLILAPLSEIYGRRVVLDISNWVFVAFQLGCALSQNMQTLIVCRLFAGFGGAGCLALAPGLVADLYSVPKRGLGTTVMGLGGIAGPVLGPVIGGIIGQRLGWRWDFWLLLILSGFFTVMLMALNLETNARVLIRRKLVRLEKDMLCDDLRNGYDLYQPESKRSLLWRGLQVPFYLLRRSWIIGLLAVYTALIFGLLFLFFLTVPSVFTNDYGFSEQATGLANLGIAIGSLVTIFAHAFVSDRWLSHLTDRNNGVSTPEMRLPLLCIYSLLLPVSFFWYGWSVDKRVNPVLAIMSTVPLAVSTTGMFMAIVTYVIDCHPEQAASAMAAITFARSMVGAVLPLVGPVLFQTLGLGWGNTVLGIVALFFVPIPMVLSRYGPAIRAGFKG
ncbi:hypothetical protein KEM52_006124 [Ascosphaera acerosa]|nr:hypothetical protein KEM52_006124 [Ascosphaera acerosa]